MENDQLIRFLQSSNLVPYSKAIEIADQFIKKNIPKNDLWLKEGRICNEYLFLEHGFMRAYAFDTEGNEITTGFYADSSVVFEVSSFF